MIAGAQRSLRIPCARETMQSIRDSVHQLLEDQIKRLGLDCNIVFYAMGTHQGQSEQDFQRAAVIDQDEEQEALGRLQQEQQKAMMQAQLQTQDRSFRRRV